jgi:hypothetical protein
VENLQAGVTPVALARNWALYLPFISFAGNRGKLHGEE